MTDLKKLRELVDRDEHVHINKLDELDVDRYGAKWLDYDTPVPGLATCVYCNAPWTPEMIELVELGGYCDTCAESDRMLEVFCQACTRLVYRKEV